MRRSRAVATTTAIVLACGILVPVVTDPPQWSVAVPPAKSRRAALAIRDDVTPFQKWGSREFTLPYLERYYDRAWYYTLSGDQRQVVEFTASVRAALADYEAVDLYLLAHSNKLIRWVETIAASDRERLRLVYNTGCTDLEQGPEWLRIGAKAYVGHAGESMSPVFYVYFLRRWTRGTALGAAVRDGNRRAFRVFDVLGPASLGNLDPGRLRADSEAVIFGDAGLRIDGGEVMRRPPWHVRWPLLALLFQLVPWIGFRCIAGGVYGDSPWLSVDDERPLTLMLLAVTAIGSAALGLTATYLVLRRACLRVAIPLIAACCIPALLGAALYSHSLLMFLTAV